MFSRSISTHIKIVNIWLVFLLIITVASTFRHWETVQPMTWINHALFFYLFLQSFFICRKETIHKSHFINIAVWAFLSSVQFINTFIGPTYALGGSARLLYEVMYSRQIFMPILVTHVIINLVVSVSFREWKPWVCTAFSFLLTGGVAVFLFRGIIFGAPLINTTSEIISGQVFKLLLMPLIALIGYWLYQFRRDPPISDHIKVLLGFFFVYLVIELTDLSTMVYKIKLYTVSQVVLFSTLLFLMIIFFNRLNYISSEFGQYYERLLMSGGRAGVSIIRKQSQTLQPLLGTFQRYFFIKPAYGAIAFLAGVLLISYLKAPQSVFVNLASIAVAFLLLFVYWWGLSRRRGLEHNVINFNQ